MSRRSKYRIKPGQYCIVRCVGAGVHAGVLIDYDRDEAILTDSRRLWKWHSRFTLSELAVLGPNDVAQCRFAITIPFEIVLEHVCEIIPCTPVAVEKIKAVPDANKK